MKISKKTISLRFSNENIVVKKCEQAQIKGGFQEVSGLDQETEVIEY